MVLLCMWVGNVEPEPQAWLRTCIDQLKSLRSTGIFDVERAKVLLDVQQDQ